jgi:asparagine synthase (glutamine-hydrolysing)
MCGICGEFFLHPERQADAARVRAMEKAIAHRGPNDDGQFLSGPCGLGFRRLSIIDLEGGHQPIANEDESVWVTLNGEIYNHLELRRELEARGHRFRTRSDTEVIAHLYEDHGSAFVDHLRGMFGIALYDVRRRRLVLARDRLGIKPVYWTEKNGCLIYGSEIKALLAHPDVTAEPNEAGLFQFLLLRHSLQPDTLFAGIHKLPAASVLEADADGIRLREYWQLRHPSPLIHDATLAAASYEQALGDAVDSHLLADVPVGLFLSGGLDSSVLAAIVQPRLNRPLVCFTAGFEGSGDETAHAARVAAHVGAEHRRIAIPAPPPEVLEELIWHLDEPLGDPACLPTWLLSREAAKELRVVLTGEGSDETNAGYTKFLRHHLFHQRRHAMSAARLLWPLLRRLPLVQARLEHLAPLWQAGSELDRLLANDQIDTCLPGSTLSRLAPGLIHHHATVKSRLQTELDTCDSTNPEQRMLHLSRAVFMREDLLMKVDRMTMAHGLEARVPYLDHHLAEVCAGLAPELLLSGGRTKAVLRNLAGRLLPPEIVQRRQHGFLVPLADWFQGNFAAYARGLLTPSNVRRRGLLDPDEVASQLSRYESGGGGARMIWNFILLELWFRRFMD